MTKKEKKNSTQAVQLSAIHGVSILSFGTVAFRFVCVFYISFFVARVCTRFSFIL